MSNRTREINKITTTIISISVKLIVYALIILLLYEAVARGYAFGHEIFYAEAVDEAPGRDMVIQMEKDESVSEAAEILARAGVIKSEFAFIFQSKFYDYDTIYPGTYTLNTAMTSKEILQLLNVKPETEEDVSPAQSGKAKAASETAAPGKSAGGASQGTREETAARDGSAAPRAAVADSGADAESQTMSPEEQSQDSMANEETYEGEDQEMEGGWFEDITEE